MSRELQEEFSTPHIETQGGPIAGGSSQSFSGGNEANNCEL